MPVGDLLPELAVLVAAVISLLAAIAVPRRQQWLGPAISGTGIAAGLLFTALQLGSSARLTFSGVWAVDGLGVWAKLLLLAAAALALAMSPDWIRSDRRSGEYPAVLLLATLGTMLMAGAADTMQLTVGVLLSSVTGYTLAAYHRDWPLSVEAGMKYFLVGAFTNTLLLIGVVWLFGLSGATGYEELAGWAAASPTGVPFLVCLTLIVVGVGFKLAAFPAHPWMPDVAQGAPAPAAAFLTVVPKIGAAVALVRLLQLFPGDDGAWRALLATIAVATMTLGNLAALWQQDLRRLLGWSSVSQSGYALVAVTVVGLTPQAAPALLFFLAGYAVANLAAFAAVTQLRGRTDLDGYRGLGRARPLLATVLIVSLLSLTGIPPLAGFVGKLLVFWAAIDAGVAWLAVAVLVNTVISLFYYLRVIGPMVFDAGDGEVHLLGPLSGATAVASGALVVVLGLGAELILRALATIVVLP